MIEKLTKADIGRHVRQISTGEIGIVRQDPGNGWIHAGVVYEWECYRKDLEFVTVTPNVGIGVLFHYENGKHADIVERLRGIVRIPITDGMGPVKSSEGENPDFFERSFPTSNNANEAASYIELLRAHIDGNEKMLEELVMLISRLVHKSMNVPEMADLRAKTMDYLVRKDLNPSPLRGVNAP